MLKEEVCRVFGGWRKMSVALSEFLPAGELHHCLVWGLRLVMAQKQLSSTRRCLLQDGHSGGKKAHEL